MGIDHSKLLFFIGNMSHSGGTERVLSVIANGLLDRGYPVAVISLWGNGRTFFELNENIKIYWQKEYGDTKRVSGRICNARRGGKSDL